MRGLAADQAGIAALGDDGRAGGIGESEDRGDFGDRARPQHQRRAAVIEIAFLAQVRRDRGWIGESVAIADDGGETGEMLGSNLGG